MVAFGSYGTFVLAEPSFRTLTAFSNSMFVVSEQLYGTFVFVALCSPFPFHVSLVVACDAPSVGKESF
jgi:hypothetical protein